ncbi:integrase [Mycobacterium sp.]|uniref:integrase n=1 Tax=Mycobacterium sp. TaxID=1785 RepID=UPI0025E70C78|nr:integrase [Mycobacterium sp.]
MSKGRTQLRVGTPVLTNAGTGVVVSFDGTDYVLRDAFGTLESSGWSDEAVVLEIGDGHVAGLSESLRPLWDSIDASAQRVALDRLEVVQEIVTGYREGHRDLARDGEPRYPFGPGFGVSESRRCEVMAGLLAEELRYHRAIQRRIHDGEIRSSTTNPSTVRNWVRAWKDRGLRGLIDGRSLRARRSSELIDPRYREAAEKALDTLDGDKSTVSIKELDRRIRVQLIDDGVKDPKVPQRMTNEYLSTLMKQRGATTRAQRSRSLRKTSGVQHFPAIRPGQIVAIDATRADNLVYSPLTGKPYSVEILTAMDVSTRVVLALRVTPRSADGIDAGLMLYDICRPFSALVQGTSMTDWRWVGLPEGLDVSQTRVRVGHQLLAPDLSTLQGAHHIPSVLPDAIHADQGAIFISRIFRAILRDLGIDLLLSRGAHPTDNPHVERWHETFQRALQQFPGYKGRNTSQRGRLVSSEPLMTAHELQDFLRRFVALDYHRSWHTGLVLPGEPGARLCPLEMWDAMVEVSGRIDVPQTPDLLYQFLPIRWLTISHQGVEWANLVYDSTALDDYRSVVSGYFRTEDCAAPFHVDPHDVSRIWFRDPKTERVQPIPWRGAARTDAPMTARMVAAACQRIRDRGGNPVLTRLSATRQILDELTELARVDKPDTDYSQLIAATLRVDQSRRDHNEAQDAMRLYPRKHSTKKSLAGAGELSTARGRWPDLLAEE